jgi:hypothetical protein
MARIAPLRYLAAIENAYFDKARTDFKFTRPLRNNPLHPLLELWEPANVPSYELGYLTKFVNLPDKVPPRPAGLGHNCDLFDSLRVCAYRAVRGFWRPVGSDPWWPAVLRQAEKMNIFDAPREFPRSKALQAVSRASSGAGSILPSSERVKLISGSWARRRLQSSSATAVSKNFPQQLNLCQSKDERLHSER